MGLWFKRSSGLIAGAETLATIPTVRFDRRHITAPVERELREAIAGLEEIPPRLRGRLYRAAVKYGPPRDLGRLREAIEALALPGIGQQDAARLAHQLASRATAAVTKDRQGRLGIVEAVWMHSGAPCLFSPPPQSDAERQRAQSHAEANGKRYRIADGLMIDGARNWPGRDLGCKCVSRAIIPGLPDRSR